MVCAAELAAELGRLRMVVVAVELAYTVPDGLDAFPLPRSLHIFVADDFQIILKKIN